MSAEPTQISEQWPDEYRELLEAYVASPTADLRRRVAALGRSLFDAGVSPHVVAAAQLQAIGGLCHLGACGDCQVLEAAQPLCADLMRAYGDACDEQRELDEYLKHHARSADRPESGLETAAGGRLEATQHIRRLLKASPAALYSCGAGPDFPTLFISENIADQLGYQPEQFYADPFFWAQRIHPEDVDRVLGELPRVEQGERVSYEYRFRHADGRYIWLHDLMAPLKDARGRVIGIAGSWFDISERRGMEEELRNASDQIERRVEERTKKLGAANRALKDEIVKRKQVVEALRKSERRYRAIVEDQTEMICRWTAGQKHTFVNDAYCRALGRGADELLGRSFMSIIPKQERASVLKHFDSLTLEHPVATIEHSVTAPDGEVRWHEWTNRAIFDDDGQLVEYQSVGRDITEKKHAEDALRKSERRYRVIVEDQTELICRWTTGHKLTFVNDAYCGAIGRSADELLGESFMQFVPVEDQPAMIKHFATLTPDHPVATNKNSVFAPDGDVCWHQWTNRAIFDEHDQLIEYQSVGRDITERKRAEDALRASEERYRGLIESQRNLIVQFDAERRFTFVNEACCRTLGKARDELLGTSFHRFVHPDDLRRTLEALDSLGRSASRVQIEQRLLTATGWRWLAWEYYPFRDEVGAAVETQGVGWDVTVRKLAERAARNRAEILEAVSHAAERFLTETDWKASVGTVLERLGIAAEVSRAYILENHVSDSGVLLTSQRYEWVAEGIESQRDGPDLQDFDWEARGFARWRDTLGAGEVVRGPVCDFPISAQLFLKPSDVRSIVVVPIFVEDRWWGAIGFSDCISEREWSQPEIDALRAAAGTLGAAIRRERTEEELRLFKTVSDDAMYAAAIGDLDGNCVYVNEGCVQLHGWSREELVGHSLSKACVGESPPSAEDLIARLLRKGSFVGVEVWHKRRDGTVFPTLMSGTVINDVNGEPKYIAVTAIDIAERMRAEEALHESEEWFRTVVNASKDAMIAIDCDGLVTIFNPAAEKMFGRSQEKVIGGSLDSLMPEKYRELHRRYVAQYAATGVPGRAIGRTLELPAVRKNGSVFPVELSLSAGRSGGRPFVFAVIRDISNRKRAEEALRLSEEKYRGIFDESVAAVYVFDADKKFVDSNQAGLELLGYTREELLGMSISEIDAEPGRVVPVHQQPLDGQRVVNHEHELRRKDGRIITVLNNSRPLTDADGNVVGMQSTLFDITERKRATEELQRRREEAADMTRLATMGEMATGLAHEVNQPLSAVLYYARGCQRRIGDDRYDKAEMLRVTEKIALQAERAGAIVDRIRRFVRRGGPRVAQADLNAVVRQAVGFVDYELRDADVRLLMELPEDLPVISADAVQVEQVVMNLIRNGVEAMRDVDSQDRKLAVRTWSAGDGMTACSISDVGAGLAPDAAENMFDAFYTTKPEGTGMGLAISRSIIESHGGRLRGRSNAICGATFEFTLPTYKRETRQ